MLSIHLAADRVDILAADEMLVGLQTILLRRVHGFRVAGSNARLLCARAYNAYRGVEPVLSVWPTISSERS